MYKVKKKLLILFLSFAMVLTCGAQTIAYGQTSDAPIKVQKTASWVDTAKGKDEGIAKVEFNVDVSDVKVPSRTVDPVELVLVLDVSKSMKGAKLTSLKTEAKAFINKMIVYEGVKIGIVKYSKTATKVCEFMDSTNKETLISKIDKLKIESGTNIQDGIRKAEAMYSTDSNTKKYMVVLSDGMPNYSYRGKTLEKGSPNLITEFKYDDMLSGNYMSYYLNGVKISGHEIGTISEAKIAEKAGINIYSIGFDIASNGTAQSVMQGIVSTGGSYQDASSTDLEIAFNNISESVIDKEAGSGAQIIDKLGSGTDPGMEYTFTIDLSNGPSCTAPSSTSNGSFLFNAETNSYKWDLTSGKLNKGHYTFTYYVKVNLNQLKDGKGEKLERVLTNDNAVLKYLDKNGAEMSLPITVNPLPVTHYSINYNYSDDGKTYSTKTTRTAVAIVGCSDKVVTEQMINDGNKEGYDFVKERTPSPLKIVSDPKKNEINLYYQKYHANGSINVIAKKAFNGKLSKYLFNFNLEKCDAEGNAYTAPAPINYPGVSDINGNITFNSIKFNEKDINQTYYYKMSENNKSNAYPFIDYSKDEFLVAIKVTDPDHNGTLRADSTYMEKVDGQWIPMDGVPTFDNKYNTDSSSVSLEVSKKLEGKALVANQFEFSAVESDQNGNPIPGAASFTAKNDENGRVVFDAVNYSTEGTHYYAITENGGGNTIDNITYDNMKVVVKVDVIDNDKGKIECKDFYPEDTEFNNTYKASEVVNVEDKTKTPIVNKVVKVKKTVPINTGDEATIIPWIIVILLAGGSSIVVALKKKKYNK